MPILENYSEFAGRHYETGTLRDALAWEGVRAPHTGEPLSEALLLGISGGIAVGYFTFHYQGYPPHLALLSRNTFDPLQTIHERLAIPRDLRQTASADKGAANLRSALRRRARRHRRGGRLQSALDAAAARRAELGHGAAAGLRS